MKTLFVAKYFLENSDESHPVTDGDIVDYLKTECGIDAEHHAIYRDIAALRNVYGMDIEHEQGRKYRLLSRQFEFDDLRLLAECVHAAMAKKQAPHSTKITFKYLKYTLQYDNNYYLLAFDDKSQEIRTYRIDCMKEVEAVNEPRDGAEAFKSIDIETYTRRVFSMFDGVQRRVRILFTNSKLDTIIERLCKGMPHLFESFPPSTFILIFFIRPPP